MHRSFNLPTTFQQNPVMGINQMFDGLVPGQVLGQGGYGTVYNARWHGTEVAVKVSSEAWAGGGGGNGGGRGGGGGGGNGAGGGRRKPFRR